MNWLSTQTNRLRTWWNGRREQVVETIRTLNIGFDTIIDNIIRLMTIGFIINVVTSYFYPEFSERFPTIYGWFNGFLQFGEFALKAALSGIYSLFTGNFSEFWAEYTAACEALLQQFADWLGTLHF